MKIFPSLMGAIHCLESDHLLTLAKLNYGNNRDVKSLLLKEVIMEIGIVSIVISQISSITNQLNLIEFVTTRAAIIDGALIIHNHI